MIIYVFSNKYRKVYNIDKVMAASLSLKVVDPYFGFALNGKGCDLAFYEKLHQKDYVCLSPYAGSAKSMQVRCPHGHKWTGLPKKVSLPLNNCKQCWDIRGLKTPEQVAEVITARNGIVITPYTRSIVKMTVQCHNGHSIDITPHNILGGVWCDMCDSIRIEISKKKFYAMIASKGGRLIGEYIDSESKVEIVCKEGHIFPMSPDHVTHEQWCPACAGNSPEYAKAKFYQTVKDRGGIPLSEHVKADVYVTILCGNGHRFYITPSSVNSGHWCRKCAYAFISEQAKEKVFARRCRTRGTDT